MMSSFLRGRYWSKGFELAFQHARIEQGRQDFRLWLTRRVEKIHRNARTSTPLEFIGNFVIRPSEICDQESDIGVFHGLQDVFALQRRALVDLTGRAP